MNSKAAFITLLFISSVFATEVIELKERNFITIRGPIGGISTTNWINQMNDISVDTLYIYLSSPGGSVMDGMKIIDQIETLSAQGVKVVCIADFAASMAFVILQHCPYRVSTKSAILMQHQMSLGTKGNLENIKTHLDFINRVDYSLDKVQAERMGLTIEEFKAKTMNDWWINGHIAKDVKAIDEHVLVKCSKDLINKIEKVTMDTFFGPVDVKFSKCPLAREPLDLNYLDDIKNIFNFNSIKEINTY